MSVWCLEVAIGWRPCGGSELEDPHMATASVSYELSHKMVARFQGQDSRQRVRVHGKEKRDRDRDGGKEETGSDGVVGDEPGRISIRQTL